MENFRITADYRENSLLLHLQISEVKEYGHFN